MPDYSSSLQQFQNIYLTLHIATICLSYIAFFVASVAAVLYLIQDNLLKNKQVGIALNRLPNLFFLDKLNYRAIGSGFPILTLSIIIGFIWAKHIRGASWSYNPREVYSLVLWLMYALILHVRLSSKLRGTKVAQLSLVAFCLVIFTLFSTCR
ncbi:MAG: cytochrome c biogenesis protein CcsA [Candidatus Omnitrophota bacterium]|nr:cytochrome c biogenesis protein CcsA [Candidatus Omnitrophota bacterium]MDP3787637.1 cytochrome c biogenesis protein CcsA [Candidatus Omnitrophota bacterium]